MADHRDTVYLSFDLQTGLPRLTLAGASHLASLAHRCIGREYPNKISHTMGSDADVAPPRELHPSFFGCFDWHSSVHGHWMLIRLLRKFPNLSDRDSVRAAIDRNLQADKIQGELNYIDAPFRHGFERTYGWAWLLKLSQELREWDDPQADTWAKNLQPLADLIESLFIEFLPRQTYPDRSGIHPNTAFGLSFAWDYATSQNREQLQQEVMSAAKQYYGSDISCPATYEPGATDFLSPCLVEADLMQRIFKAPDFLNWFDVFLPTIPQNLSIPATVSDRTDGHLVHLDGLNLSRAWCMLGIANKLPEADPRKIQLQSIAASHIEFTLPQIASGGYEGEHWLASFAIYALSAAGK